jgi:hypothetical protein
METTHHKKVLQREDSSSLSSRHPIPTLTPLPLCSGTSKHLSMGEEVGTMQIKVLGEIKKMNKMRGEKIQSTSHVKKKKEKTRKTRKRKKIE